MPGLQELCLLSQKASSSMKSDGADALGDAGGNGATPRALPPASVQRDSRNRKPGFESSPGIKIGLTRTQPLAKEN